MGDIPALFNQFSSDFSRQLLIPRIASLQEAIYFYGTNSPSTTLLVNVTTTTVVVTYISNTSSSSTFTYTNKSLYDLCAEINASELPINAIAISPSLILSEGDLVSTGSAKEIPLGFSYYDRKDGGVIIRSKKVTVKNRSQKNVTLLSPYSRHSSLPWYPRISVGKFSYSVKGKTYNFQIPEYSNQAWSTTYGKPIMDIEGDVVELIDSKTIKLSRKPVYWTGSNIVLYNNVKPISNSNILDVDIHNGIVYLNTEVYADSGSLTADYSYIEKNYTYKKVNLNSHYSQNPFIQGKSVVIYLIPYIFSESIPSKSCVRHSIGDSILEATNSIPRYDYPIAIIGAYSVSSTYSSDSVSLLDTRSFGGGLVDSRGPKSPVHTLPEISDPLPQIEDKYVEARNFYDIGRADGEIYPGAASVVVDLPQDIRKVIPENLIREKATKFLSAGVYPVFDFTERDLPSISGNGSTQIAAVYNLSLTSPLSGAGLVPHNFTVPSGSVYLNWNSNELPVVSELKREGQSHYIRINSNTGYFIPYLRSKPMAAIEWEERDYSYTSGNLDNHKSTAWVKKRIYDSESIGNLELVKRQFYISTKANVKDIRNIKIHSPYQTSFSENLKNNLSGAIEEIYSGYVSSDIGYITEQYSDVENGATETLIPYFGLHPGLDFLFEAPSAGLTNYTGALETIGTYLSAGVADGLFKIYEPTNNEFYNTFVLSDINIIRPLRQLAKLALYLKNTYGIGDEDYLAACTGVIDVVNRLEQVNNVFLEDYTIVHQSGADILVDTPYSSGHPYSFASTYVLTRGEVTDLNQDYMYLNMAPPIAAAIASMPNLETSITGAYTGLTGYATYISTEMSKCNESINYPLTYSGNALTSTWLTRHNRYSSYLANYLSNLTQSYDILFSPITGHYSSYTGYTGYSTSSDPQMLDLIFKAITTGISLSMSGVVETLARRGVQDPGMLDVIAGYGWYYNNYARHTELFTGYSVNTGQVLGVFETGLYSILSSIVDEQGYIHEVPVLQGERLPHYPVVPDKLFNALKEGIRIDQKFTNYANAVFNTVTGLYNYDGKYIVNSTKQYMSGSSEYNLISKFVEMYKYL